MPNDMLLNQIIGAIIGIITSIGVSWFFYKKTDIFDKVAAARLRNLERLAIEKRLGKSFSVVKRFPAPKNLDIPHIEYVWSEENPIYLGKPHTLLLYIADGGFNFRGQDGIRVVEKIGRRVYNVNREGHGYYSCEIYFPLSAEPGLYVLQFILRDWQDLEFVQELQITVLPSSPGSSHSRLRDRRDLEPDTDCGVGFSTGGTYTPLPKSASLDKLLNEED